MNSTTTLYLRTDGSLMLARGGHTIEVRLTPPQLLQLGLDCLQTAVQLDAGATARAAAILEAVVIPPALLPSAHAAMGASQVAPADADAAEAACRTH